MPQPQPAPKPRPQPAPEAAPKSVAKQGDGFGSQYTSGGGGGFHFSIGRLFSVLAGAISFGFAGYLAWNSLIGTIPQALVFSGLFGFGLAGLATMFDGTAEFRLGRMLKLTGYLAVFMFILIVAMRALGVISIPNDDVGLLNAVSALGLA